MKAKMIKKGLMIFLFAGILFGVSCQEDKLDAFNGETNIYFSLQRWWPSSKGIYTYNLNFPIGDNIYTETWNSTSSAQDSIVRSYARNPSPERFDTAYIPVSIMGDLKEYDRTFNCVVTNTTVEEGRDFKVIASMIPANQIMGAIAIQLERAAFTDTTHVIDFRLLPGNELYTNYTEIDKHSASDTTKVDLLKFRLVVTDILVKPPRWYNGYLGPFSRKKMYLLIELTNLNVDYFYGSPQLAEQFSWGFLLKKYLREQANLGNIIYEEDGVTPMAAGSSV